MSHNPSSRRGAVNEFFPHIRESKDGLTVKYAWTQYSTRLALSGCSSSKPISKYITFRCFQFLNKFCRNLAGQASFVVQMMLREICELCMHRECT